MISIERWTQALRTLLRNKRFASLAIVSLGVAIALNTVMFSALDATLNPRVTIRDADRIYTLGFMGDFRRRIPLHERNAGLEGLRSFDAWTRGVQAYSNDVAERGDRVRPAAVRIVAPNYFDVVQVAPLAGRVLTPSDASSQGSPIVVSERLWKQLYPDSEFRESATMVIGTRPREVIGVLPASADFPGWHTDVWMLPDTAIRTFGYQHNVGRLRPGVSEAEAKRELDALAKRWTVVAGDEADSWFRLSAAKGEPFQFQRFHFALIGAVLALLLVACFNLANLQLARGLARAREMATRAAVGASRRALVAGLMIESAWLGLGGLLLGVVLTLWGMRIVATTMPPTLADFILQPQTSWRVFAFAALITAVALFAVGLVPAIRTSRVDIGEALKIGAGTGMSRRVRRQYGVLVTVQVALALSLLVSAGLLLRTSVQLHKFSFDARVEKLVDAFVRVRPDSGRGAYTAGGVANELLARARAVPGVAEAAVSNWMAPDSRRVSVADAGGTAVEVGTGLWGYQLVSSSYLRTRGLRITRGRDFSEGEFAEKVVIVDERTARYLWPGANPVGQLIKLGDATSDQPWLRVVGVSEFINVRQVDGADMERREAPRMGDMYVLMGADAWGRRIDATPYSLRVTVRARGATDQLPNAMRQELAMPARGITVQWAQRRVDQLGLALARERQDFVTGMFLVFALLGLAVAALGVYAVVSHSVSQRTREFGVRIALGAGERDIRQRVLFEGNVMALAGIAMGLVIAAQGAGMLRAFLRGDEDRYDSWLYAVVAAILFGVTLLASWIPARRAVRIDPVNALRND